MDLPFIIGSKDENLVSCPRISKYISHPNANQCFYLGLLHRHLVFVVPLMCPAGFGSRQAMQSPSRPSFLFLSRFRCHFPACHKELEAVLLNNRNDIPLSPVPVFQLICIWGPPNGNKWHICIHLPHCPCDLSDIKQAFLITQWGLCLNYFSFIDLDLQI